MRLLNPGGALLLLLTSAGCELIGIASQIDLASRHMSGRPACADYLSAHATPEAKQAFGPGGLCVDRGAALLSVCEGACEALQQRPAAERPAAEAAVIAQVRGWLGEVATRERAAIDQAEDAAAAGARTPASSAHPSPRVCAHYLGLVKGNVPGFLSQFGPDGRCWSAGPAVAGRCSQQCVQLTSFASSPPAFEQRREQAPRW